MRNTDLDWPLMKSNITRADLDAVIRFLQAGEPILTQSNQVMEFEREWSDWLGVRHSVLVNSGSSANDITLAAIRDLAGDGEVLVPPLAWVSDVASILHAGLTPVFVDINLRTLGLDIEETISRLSAKTRAVLLVHILGQNALDQRLLDALATRGIPLIEDACESVGATFEGRKVGTFGLASNFSFYYAHHLSTIEGGIVSTNDDDFFQQIRMRRSHGLVREATAAEVRRAYIERHPDLSPDFIFAHASHNMRSTEINAVIGRSQLRRLDENNRRRRENFALFLDLLDPERFATDFSTEGSCNYALILVLRKKDDALCEKVINALRDHHVEFRRGLSGGGNQLRQPYLRRILGNRAFEKFPVVDHVHFYGFYLGNYPDLERWKIETLCNSLNQLSG